MHTWIAPQDWEWYYCSHKSKSERGGIDLELDPVTYKIIDLLIGKGFPKRYAEVKLMCEQAYNMKTSSCYTFYMFFCQVKSDMKPQLLTKISAMEITIPYGPMASFNWLFAPNNGKDVGWTARLELFIGQERDRHCPNKFLGKNKIEMIQTNTVNSWGAGGSPSANKHIRKEDRMKAFPEQILVQTERQTRVCLSLWPFDLGFVAATLRIVVE